LDVASGWLETAGFKMVWLVFPAQWENHWGDNLFVAHSVLYHPDSLAPKRPSVLISGKLSAKTRIALGIAVALVLGFVGYTSLRDRSFHALAFDSDAWKQGDARVRGEMVASLCDQSLLRGKAREEVIALLGKAEEDLQGLLRYRVDVGRRVDWKPLLVSLVVEFDDKGRVHRAITVD
jgi:hypothetical protein